MATINEGQVFTDIAVVKGVKDGLLVDLGEGESGYLHVSQLMGRDDAARHARLEELKNSASTETPAKVTVAVTKVTPPDIEGGKPSIRVSEWQVEKTKRDAARKQREESLLKLQPGSVHKGTVKKLFDWGVIVTVEGGLDGKLHGSNLKGKDRKARDARLAELTEGKPVLVEVIERGEDERGRPRFSFSEQKAEARTHGSKFQPGYKTSGVFVKNGEQGLVIDLGHGVEGILPATTEDLGGAEVNSIAKKGQSVKVWVARIAKDGTVVLTRNQKRVEKAEPVATEPVAQ